MSLETDLDHIPRGNTAPGVNRTVIDYLSTKIDRATQAAVLDVPCGNGEFIAAVTTLFPGLTAVGVDIAPPDREGFVKADLSSSEELKFETRFDVITSISGVMEFDNTLNFLRRLREIIADDGLLIVTNDNLLSVRDRVLYFFSGRFRQYPMFIADDAPTWKILPLQNLMRILRDAGFETAEIRYVPAKWTEWFWLPIALPIYLSQNLAFALGRDAVPYKEKAARYPFVSLFSRHFILICRPN
ncbi:MAG: methyltransferase domain-containing protein [Acidobacteriota bacterium]